MFGIKTKKDKNWGTTKRDRLKTITYQNVDVNTLCSEFTLPIEALEAIPEEHIKSIS